jgi:hypothetical protein
VVLRGFWAGLDCPRMSTDFVWMRTDWILVPPHKIDGFPTRSLSRGRGFGFFGWFL